MKVANCNDWRTDPVKLANGVPYEFSGDGRAFIVRRGGTRNREFVAAMADVDRENEPAVMACYARAVVVGWTGFKDAAGADVPYTPEDCLDVFMECPELFDRVALFASQRANYSADEQDANRDALKVTAGG